MEGKTIDKMSLDLECSNIDGYAFRGLHNFDRIIIKLSVRRLQYNHLNINLAKLQYFMFESLAEALPSIKLDAPKLKVFRYRCDNSLRIDYNVWELYKAAESIEIVTLNTFVMELDNIQ